MKKPKQLLVVFKNQWDGDDEQFTIILKDGDVYKSSDKAFDEARFHHNIADSRMIVEYGAFWRKRCDVKKCTKYAIDKFLNDIDVIRELGKKIDWILLPKEVQQYIAMICDPPDAEVK